MASTDELWDPVFEVPAGFLEVFLQRDIA